jgi:nitric oxide reductase activation protein
MNDVEVNDTFDDLDAAMASKKRGRDAAIAEQEAIEAADQVRLGLAIIYGEFNRNNRSSVRC